MGNPPPQHFYKYRSLSGDGLKHCEDIFTNNRLFWPSPRSFNDPFDCAPVPEFPISSRERRQYARELIRRTATSQSKAERSAVLSRILKDDLAALEKNAAAIVHGRLANVGVCSFSEIETDILMWSHYANSHQGICLRFSPTAYDWEHFLPHEVVYSLHRPTLVMRNEDMVAWCRAALLTKARQWDYEKEWRTFDINGPGLKAFRPSMLDAVILGARISEEIRKTILRFVKGRSAQPMRVFNASFHPRDFLIQIE